jgi:hypothetical protein
MSSDCFAALDLLLEATPIEYEGEPILLAQLDHIRVERDVWEYVQRADDLNPMPVQRTVLTGAAISRFDRWPKVRVKERLPSDVSLFNAAFFRNFDNVRDYAFKQSDIAGKVSDNIDADIIVLLLIDGLSFSDWADKPNVVPCLAEAPTITSVGFKSIIGKHSIAAKLFDKGVHRRLGFSYWSRENPLTNFLFRGFDARTQMVKVAEYEEVLRVLSKPPINQTYVQIIVDGMDGICHHHRGRPKVRALANALYDDLLMALAETLHKAGVTALVYAIADHGILWKPKPSDRAQLVRLPFQGTASMRYVKGSHIVPHSRNVTSGDVNYTVLSYPYVFSNFSSLEWGTHGGLSFEESIVPFVSLEV